MALLAVADTREGSGPTVRDALPKASKRAAASRIILTAVPPPIPPGRSEGRKIGVDPWRWNRRRQRPRFCCSRNSGARSIVTCGFPDAKCRKRNICRVVAINYPLNGPFPPQGNAATGTRS